MKIATVLVGAALLIITAVMLFLVKSGGALKPAGVIKPAEIGSDSGLIGRSVALRLFPEFRAAKNVIWYLETSDEPIASVPQITHLNYQTTEKPLLLDLRSNTSDNCVDNCWYIQAAGSPLPEAVRQKLKSESTIEIFVQNFDREEQVPAECEKEKILETQCVRPVAVREVRRKIKTPAPHFFMQRYLSSQFYLFIEKSK